MRLDVPLPLAERDPFDWAVPIGFSPIPGFNHPTEPVQAFETCCEYLYVHESSGIPGWTVSHKLTRYALAQGLESYEAARYVAGALKYLFRWSEDHAPYYKTRISELPAPLQNWLRSFARRFAFYAKPD